MRIKIGERYKIWKEGERENERRVRVISRAGKKGGKHDGCYNLRDSLTKGKTWLNLNEFNVERDEREEASMNEE